MRPATAIASSFLIEVKISNHPPAPVRMAEHMLLDGIFLKFHFSPSKCAT
jgi:hypothetical protein